MRNDTQPKPIFYLPHLLPKINSIPTLLTSFSLGPSDSRTTRTLQFLTLHLPSHVPSLLEGEVPPKSLQPGSLPAGVLQELLQ